MARLTDPEKLRCYKNALSNYKFSGYVEFTQVAWEWLRRNLDGYTQKRFAELLLEYVEEGSEIDEVVETRPEWSRHRYHYDLRPSSRVGGCMSRRGCFARIPAIPTTRPSMLSTFTRLEFRP